MLASGISTALPHLRAINPQVVTILAAAAAKGGPRPHLPRQGCMRALPGAANGSSMGISSFAFQVLFRRCCSLAYKGLQRGLRSCKHTAATALSAMPSSCNQMVNSLPFACRGRMRMQSFSKRCPASGQTAQPRLRPGSRSASGLHRLHMLCCTSRWHGAPRQGASRSRCKRTHLGQLSPTLATIVSR
jgi:hypothetical protein